MRIKICTNPPLPPLKAWFPITFKPDPGSSAIHSNPEPTVHTLKSHMCAFVPALRPFLPSNLRLLIDEFELLDECELNVVRDGDLVYIEQIQSQEDHEEAHITKRQVPHEKRDSKEPKSKVNIVGRKTDTMPTIIPPRKRKRRDSLSSASSEPEALRSSSSSPSSSSDSSESESESESESTSEGDSHSDSDSASSTSRTTPSLSKGPRYTQDQARARSSTAKVQQNLRTSTSADTAKAIPFVPPGFGKPQTRARNLRRRIKRQHEREAAAPSEGRASGANAIIAGENLDNPREESEEQSVALDAPATTSHFGANSVILPSLSLRNRNKAKNFRALMSRPLPPKIIFSDLENEASTSATPVSQVSQAAESSTSVQRPLPPLVPPSSRTSLPPNLFVTSIDVEAGMWRPKKKQKMSAEYEGSFANHDIANMEVGGGRGDRDVDVALDYGDEVNSHLKQDDLEALELFANQNWSNLPRITQEEQASPERIVAYKSLGINPTTFTPEYLLTLARIISLKTESTVKKLVVRPLRSPAEVSFSGPCDDNERVGVEEIEDEEHTWEDVVQNWRIVER